MSGSRARAYRVGSAPLITGRPLIRAYGPGRPVRSPARTILGPNDSPAMSRAVTTEATVTADRQRHATQSATTTRSGQPRNVLNSVASVANLPFAGAPATDSGENNR